MVDLIVSGDVEGSAMVYAGTEKECTLYITHLVLTPWFVPRGLIRRDLLFPNETRRQVKSAEQPNSPTARLSFSDPLLDRPYRRR